MQPLYVLTPMTGREAAEQRTVVIGTVELNWRLWTILIAAFPVAILMTAMVWLFLGQLALIMLPITLGAAVILFYRRSSQGLQLRTYQALWDRRRAKASDTFFLCGQPINTRDTHVRRLLTTSVPYGPDATVRPAEAPLAPEAPPTGVTPAGRGSAAPAAVAAFPSPPVAVPAAAPLPPPVPSAPVASSPTDVSALFI